MASIGYEKTPSLRFRNDEDFTLLRITSIFRLPIEEVLAKEGERYLLQ